MQSEFPTERSAIGTPYGTERAALDALKALGRSGPSPLAFWCALAMRASELCDGRRLRVVLPEVGPDGTAREPGAGPEPAPTADRVGGWVPVGETNRRDREDFRWWVEVRGDEAPPACLDDVASLARWAGILSEPYRLAGELRRTRREAAEALADVAHRLRGHLGSALMRASSLLLALRSGEANPAQVVEDVERLQDAVQSMARAIAETLEVPDGAVRGGAAPRAAPGELVRIEHLVRAARDAAGVPVAGDLALEVESGVPPIRADRRWLRQAVAELLDAVRRSGGTATLAVGPQPSPEGVRVTLRLDSSPLPESDLTPWIREPESSRPVREAESAPSLREVVAELGGWMSIEAGAGTGAEVRLFLPTAPRSPASVR